MCQPASMIVTRGHRVHWSENTDSHHEIISEYGIKETDARGEINIVPVEIKPPDGDLTNAINKWVFRVDYMGYDRGLPEWWDAEKGEAAVRAALKDWKKKKVVTRKVAVLNGGQFYICGKAEVGSIEGGSKITVGGSATIQYVGGSATIQYVGDSATIQYVRDSATIQYVGDSATIQYVGGSATIQYVGGSATIQYVRDSATIQYVGDSATIQYVGDSATIIVYTVIDPQCLKSTTAVMVDRSKHGEVNVIVGMQKAGAA